MFVSVLTGLYQQIKNNPKIEHNFILQKLITFIYSNRLFIIVTQYEKFGSLITATKESHVTELDRHSEVYTTKYVKFKCLQI